MNTPRTSPRRWSATPPTLVAPASCAASRRGSTCSGASLIPGIKGAIRMPVGIAAGVEAEIAVGRTREAVGTGMGASPVRIDRPPERHPRRLGHPVEHRLRVDLVEASLERLRCVEPAHRRGVAMARKLGLLLGVE